MRLVDCVDGVIMVRWTWLPYWLAANSRLITDLERELATVVLSGPVTNAEDDLDQLHDVLCRALQDRFPGFPGLGAALQATKLIQPPQSSGLT